MKISTSTFSQERLFEFVTVGRDQVQFWGFNKDHRLEYYDVFIETLEKEESEPDVTCVDYFDKDEQLYVICGLESGEVVIIKYGDF